jgi:hypothetical protein
VSRILPAEPDWIAVQPGTRSLKGAHQRAWFIRAEEAQVFYRERMKKMTGK